MEDSGNSIKLLGAVILGAAIGATLGVLYAPDKGTETRKKIAGGADLLTDSLKDKFNLLLEEAKKEIELANTKAIHFAENNKTK
jgi:gas vesicle protein